VEGNFMFYSNKTSVYFKKLSQCHIFHIKTAIVLSTCRKWSRF